MKPLDFVPIVLGVLVLVLAHFFPDLQATLLPVGGGLIGQGLPNLTAMRRPSDPSAGHGSPATMFLCGFAAMCLFGLAPLACSSTQLAKDKAFVSKVLACAQTNPARQNENAAALACIADVATQDYIGCLVLLPATWTWGADELACVCKSVQ